MDGQRGWYIMSNGSGHNKDQRDCKLTLTQVRLRQPLHGTINTRRGEGTEQGWRENHSPHQSEHDAREMSRIGPCTYVDGVVCGETKKRRSWACFQRGSVGKTHKAKA